jgi:Fur family ferric uptake transcriptional regulator
MITAEELLDRLREQGGRVTTARRLVVSTLLGATGHITAEELAATIQEQHPEVHLSTVYRTLDSLEKLGIVAHTHVGHGPSVYHVGVTHQHLVCEECGAVIDVPTQLLEGVQEALRDQYGFELHIGHFALLGRCASHTHMRTVRISPNAHPMRQSATNAQRRAQDEETTPWNRRVDGSS